MRETLVIGVTDCSKYKVYADWVQQADERIEIIQLSSKKNNLAESLRCHGVVLTGGEDVHPRFYHKPEYYPYCYADDVSETRDDFEWRVLDITEKNNIPVLGICRGLQMANVFFGGTLIPDLPSWHYEDHAKLSNGTDRYHHINTVEHSQLFAITRQHEGRVNSNHHQAVEELGKGLKTVAFSTDEVVEAAERSDIDAGPFLCLLQWHPERMQDQQSPFAKNIREAFIHACDSITT